MALSYTARRRWALVILIIGMPVYVVTAVTLVGLIERPPFLVELLVYVGLGFLWALPFRFIFRGIGQDDPAAKKTDGNDPSA
jgi:threonine/homoserine/homoserine lactone efflux protein